jgi:blue copper oxidase
MAHPFHIHGASFRILSLDGAPPPAHLSGPKDTVLINEVAELLISFDQVTNPAKPFVFHCDIFCGTGHEELEGAIVVIE